MAMYEVRDRDGKLMSEHHHRGLAIERLVAWPAAYTVTEVYEVRKLIATKEGAHETCIQEEAKAPF